MRIALHFYCRTISFSLKPPDDLPTILACNHPNSFLDALIIGSHYQRPVHYLARGDVFAKPWIRYLLRKIHMIPVYRLTEGRTQLKNNEATFRECLSILENRGVVLIFAEGICKNERSVQPLKKGTARLAFMAWHEANLTEMIIRPLSLTYSSFTDVPMNVCIIEGATTSFFNEESNNPNKFYQRLNEDLHQQLETNLVAESKMHNSKPSVRKKLLLALPALIGWITHKWLYNFLKEVTKRKTKNTVFFHSVLFGLLLLTYPILLLAVVFSLTVFTGKLSFLLLIPTLPLFAWSYKEFRS